jgi:hypothetical protein
MGGRHQGQGAVVQMTITMGSWVIQRQTPMSAVGFNGIVGIGWGVGFQH